MIGRRGFLASLAVLFAATLAAVLYFFLRSRGGGAGRSAGASPASGGGLAVGSEPSGAGGASAGGGLPVGNGAPAGRAPDSRTVSNLMAAYDRSLALEVKRLAFAAVADAEGFRDIATLFRAAARADAIHAALFTERLAAAGTPSGGGRTAAAPPSGLGAAARIAGCPEVQPQPTGGADAAPPPRTPGNLRSCIEENIRLHDTVYADFLKTAREERDKAAVEAFNYARTVAGELASLFSKALENPDAWKAGGRTFYVCSVCGRVQTGLKGTQCTLCFADNSKFVAVR
ncbi:MAG: hypothetical protein N3A38_11650 [Planctomycetota bacterium]|nr:hypothetical protein [Planctomycetota bacterium]